MGVAKNGVSPLFEIYLSLSAQRVITFESRRSIAVEITTTT
jgi:hypothetical protein